MPESAARTIPQLFRATAERLKGRTARRRKTGGRWVAQTWTEFAKSVEDLARGLVALGVKPGRAVAIFSQSRAEWVECDLAILSAGAISVPIYPSSTTEQAEYIIQNSEAAATNSSLGRRCSDTKANQSRSSRRPGRMCLRRKRYERGRAGGSKSQGGG